MAEQRTAVDALDEACRLCRRVVDLARDPWADGEGWADEAEVQLASLLAERDYWLDYYRRARSQLASIETDLADLKAALDRVMHDSVDPR